MRAYWDRSKLISKWFKTLSYLWPIQFYPRTSQLRKRMERIWNARWRHCEFSFVDISSSHVSMWLQVVYSQDDWNVIQAINNSQKCHDENGCQCFCEDCVYAGKWKQSIVHNMRDCIILSLALSLITFVSGQTDGSNEVCYRHAIVKSKQSHVTIEVTVAELLWDRSQYESRLGTCSVVASVVLAERY